MQLQSIILLCTAVFAAAAPMYQILPQVGQPLEVQALSARSRVEKREGVKGITRPDYYKPEEIYPAEEPFLNKREATEEVGSTETTSRVSQPRPKVRTQLQPQDFSEIPPLPEWTSPEQAFIEHGLPELDFPELSIPVLEGSPDLEDLSLVLSKTGEAFTDALESSEVVESMPGSLAKMFNWWLKAIPKTTKNMFKSSKGNIEGEQE